MERFEIDKHEVFSFLEADINTIAKLSIKTKKGEKTELSPRQMYVMETFWCLNEIDHKLKDLDHAYLFMKSYPSIRSWRDKMTREEYYLYHYESYLNSMISLLDRLLHLVNHIYDLGLSDNNVKLEILLTNSKIDNTVKAVLKKYDGFLQRQEIKRSRNSASHKERPRIAEFTPPSTLEFSATLPVTSASDKKAFLGLAKIMYRARIREKNTKILNHILQSQTEVRDLLNILLPKIKKDYLKYSI